MVDMAKSGPAVMAAAGERKQQSNRLQAHVPSWSSRGALSREDDAPVFRSSNGSRTQPPREPPVSSH
jgi:hypothetical protein